MQMVKNTYLIVFDIIGEHVNRSRRGFSSVSGLSQLAHEQFLAVPPVGFGDLIHRLLLLRRKR